MSTKLEFDITSYKDLSLDDLSKIIRMHRNRLSGLIKLYNQKKSGKELEYTSSEDYITTNIKLISRNVLNLVGFSEVPLYKREAEILSEELCNALKWSKPHGPYSNELLSVCIISVILNYYNIKFDEVELLIKFDLKMDKYIKLLKKCESWSYKNYWKKI